MAAIFVAIHDVVTTACGRGHAGVVRRNAQLRSHREVEAVAWFRLNHTVFLVGTPHDGITERTATGDVEHQPVTVILRRGLVL